MIIQRQFLVYRVLSVFYLITVYAKGVLSKGAWLDDWGSLVDSDSAALHATRDGRPVYAWMIRLLFGFFDELDTLFMIRIFGLLGLLLLSDLVMKQALKIKPSFGLFLAIVFSFTIPAFQFPTHMANAFGFCWTIYLMLQGFLIYSQVHLKKRVLGICFGVLSLLTYPLMSFFTFPFIYFLWLISGANFQALFKKLFQGIGYFTFSFLFSILSLKIYLLFSGLEFNSRVQLVGPEDLFSKIVWFVTRPFLLSYRPFLISSPTPLQAATQFVCAFVLICVCFYLRYRGMRLALANILIFNAIICLSLAPLFLAAQNEIEIYFILSSSWLFVVLLVYFTADLGYRKMSTISNFRSSVTIVFTVVLLLAGFLGVNGRFDSNIGQIERSTFSFLSNQIDRCSESELNSGVTLLSRTKDWPVKPNLGVYSQTTDLQSIWVPVQAVRVILRDRNPITYADTQVSWGVKDNPGCIVDLNEF